MLGPETLFALLAIASLASAGLIGNYSVWPRKDNCNYYIGPCAENGWRSSQVQGGKWIIAHPAVRITPILYGGKTPVYAENLLHCVSFYFGMFYLGYDAFLMNGLQVIPRWQDYLDYPFGNLLGFTSAVCFGLKSSLL
ncbi:hypothetical protein F5Y16DRAFT_406759 [Xylariaceae sp. FL0255]|nr:hypothetical protein F5Y16DRAFT_406759 [Xylariaceae sp. FL0255]